MSTPGNTVTIVIGARANTDTGFDRVRTAVRNLGRSIHENFGDAGRRSGMSFTDRLRNVLSQGMASIGEAGGGLGRSLGQSISSAGSSPYVAAGVAALVAAIAPMIGVLLGGAIVLGVGGGLAAIGIMAAAKAKEVQTAFGKAKDAIGKSLSEAAKPLEPVLIHVAERVTKMAEKMEKPLGKIFGKMAPHLEKFFDHLADSIERAAPALEPLADAFNEILDALGPEVGEFIEQFADSLGKLGKEMGKKENAEGFAKMIGLMLKAIPKAVDLITLLAEQFREMKPDLEKAWDAFKKLADLIGPVLGLAFKLLGGYIKVVLTIWSTFVDLIIDGYKKVKKWAGEAIDKIKDFIDWVKKIKGKTVKFAQKGIAGVKKKIEDLIDKIKGFKNKTVKFLQNGAENVRRRVQDAINTIKRFIGKTVKLGVSGVTAAIDAVQRLINRIKNLVGKTVSVGVNFFKNTGGAIADFLGFAHGGNIGGIGSAATGGARSALTLVGEQGPELVRLPFGSSVHSNPDTRSMIGGSGGGGQPIVINLLLDGRVLAQQLIDPLRGEVRSKGGNVQSVLGR